MQLTIIPVDGFVGKNNMIESCLGVDLTSCNIPSNVHCLQWNDMAGYIEFNTPIPNEEITALPTWASCCITKCDEANRPPIPVPQTAEQNKQTAVTKLSDTDWTTIPDVSDPAKSNPYLSNFQEFITYRNAVRQYAIYPVAGDINWPVIPQEVWTTV